MNPTDTLVRATCIAAALLDDGDDSTPTQAEHLPALGAWLLYQHVLGGDTVLVSDVDGTYLLADSMESPGVHLANFVRGERDGTSQADLLAYADPVDRRYFARHRRRADLYG